MGVQEVSVPFRHLVAAEAQTFADEGDRRRLSATALTAYKSLCERWSLTTNEAAALLGVSASTWERMKRDGRDQVLSQDQLTRISAMVGVFKGLKLLFADDMGDRWPRLANRGPLFEGLSPVDAMLRGGIPRMLEIRRHVDSLRGGL
jgi:uncharacterized protein (DUF2384 family)